MVSTKKWPLRALIISGAALTAYTLLLVPTQGQQPPQAAEQTPVILNVLVTDKHNRPVSDITQDQLQIFDDGIPQTISFFSKEVIPISYALVVDISGSLRKQFGRVIEAAKAIVENNQSNDDTFLIAFRDKAEAVLPDFTSDKASLWNEIGEFYRWKGGQTALIDAIYLSLDPLIEHRKNEGPAQRRRAVILISDGEDHASYYKEDELLKRLSKETVQVFAIALTSDLNDRDIFPSKNPRERATNLLKRLAKETGGYVLLAESKSNMQSLAKDAMLYLHTQYVVAYNRANRARDGSYHKVLARVMDKPGGEKRTTITRVGYTTDKR